MCLQNIVLLVRPVYSESLKLSSQLQNPVDPQEGCQGPRGVTRRYQIRYQIGSFKVYENVNATTCRDERCSHMYNLLTVQSEPSSYDSVSVAAENVVGFGAARTCTAQTISKLKTCVAIHPEMRTAATPIIPCMTVDHVPSSYDIFCQQLLGI